MIRSDFEIYPKNDIFFFPSRLWIFSQRRRRTSDCTSLLLPLVLSPVKNQTQKHPSKFYFSIFLSASFFPVKHQTNNPSPSIDFYQNKNKRKKKQRYLLEIDLQSPNYLHLNLPLSLRDPLPEKKQAVESLLERRLAVTTKTNEIPRCSSLLLFGLIDPRGRSFFAIDRQNHRTNFLLSFAPRRWTRTKTTHCFVPFVASVSSNPGNFFIAVSLRSSVSFLRGPFVSTFV